MNESRPHPERDAIQARRYQTELMLAFSRVHQQILRRSAQLLESAGIAGITPARANALVVLFNARRPINARELASELAISEVTVSRFIRKMEEDGWVERTPDPTDRRAILLRTTAYAREQFPPLVTVCNEVLDDLFSELSTEELHTLGSLVGKVQQALADKTGLEG